MKPREEFFCGDGISARVQGGAAKRFHANEDRGTWRENFERVSDEVLRVVILAAAQVPVVTDPRQGLCLSNFNGVANERRAGLSATCEKQNGRARNSEPRGTHLIECAWCLAS